MRLSSIALVLIGFSVAGCGITPPWSKAPIRSDPPVTHSIPKRTGPAIQISTECDGLRAEADVLDSKVTAAKTKDVLVGVGGLTTPIIVLTEPSEPLRRRQKELAQLMDQKKCK